MRNFKELLDKWKELTKDKEEVMLILAEGVLREQRENAPQEIEKIAIDFKELLDKLPQKHRDKFDVDALRFLGVLIMDFLPVYYQARGLAVDAKEGKQVDQKIVLRIAHGVFGYSYVFRTHMKYSFGFQLLDEP